MYRNVSHDSTSDLIAAVSDRLTPTERRIAEVLLEEPTLLAFGTVSNLAERVGTSRPSIVRFAHKLGFEGYKQLQENGRRSLSHQLFRPSDRIRHEGSSGSPARTALTEAMSGVFEAVKGDELVRLSTPIIGAEAVWIISGETSRAGAHALLSGLTIVRPSVHLVDAHSIGSDLAGVHARDCAVIFDFFRYRQQTVEAARIVAESGAEIVAITDGPLSPLAGLTDTWCELIVPAVGPLDSSVPAVAIAELLVAQVAHSLQDTATDRIDRIEELWERTGTFLPKSP